MIGTYRPHTPPATRSPAMRGRTRRPSTLLIEPPVFAAVCVVEAVDHQGHVLDIGLPAGAGAGIEDDRAGDLLGGPAFDRPDHLLALFLVALHRLPLDHLVDLRIAITVPIEARAAAIEQVEDRVGIRPARLQVKGDGKVLAPDLREVIGGFDRVELAVDVNLLQLVDKQDRRIAVKSEIPGRNLDVEPLVRPIAELLHDLAGLRAVFLHIRIIAGHFLQQLRSAAPTARPAAAATRRRYPPALR